MQISKYMHVDVHVCTYREYVYMQEHVLQANTWGRVLECTHRGRVP